MTEIGVEAPMKRSPPTERDQGETAVHTSLGPKRFTIAALSGAKILAQRERVNSGRPAGASSRGPAAGRR